MIEFAYSQFFSRQGVRLSTEMVILKGFLEGKRKVKKVHSPDEK